MEIHSLTSTDGTAFRTNRRSAQGQYYGEPPRVSNETSHSRGQRVTTAGPTGAENSKLYDLVKMEGILAEVQAWLKASKSEHQLYIHHLSQSSREWPFELPFFSNPQQEACNARISQLNKAYDARVSQVIEVFETRTSQIIEACEARVVEAYETRVLRSVQGHIRQGVEAQLRDAHVDCLAKLQRVADTHLSQCYEALDAYHMSLEA